MGSNFGRFCQNRNSRILYRAPNLTEGQNLDKKFLVRRENLKNKIWPGPNYFKLCLRHHHNSLLCHPHELCCIFLTLKYVNGLFPLRPFRHFRFRRSIASTLQLLFYQPLKVYKIVKYSIPSFKRGTIILIGISIAITLLLL